MNNKKDLGLEEAIEQFNQMQEQMPQEKSAELKDVEMPQMSEQQVADENTEDMEEKDDSKRKRVIIIAAIAVAVIAIAGIILFLVNHQKSQAKEVEPAKTTKAVEADNPLEVDVQESIEVEAANTFSSDMVITEMKSDTDIVSVAFREYGTAEGVVGEDGVLTAATASYPEVGTMVNAVIVTDADGNTIEKEFTVNVIENLLWNTQGIGDKSYLVGSVDVNFMDGIAWNEKIQAVTCDSSQVNLGAAGQYPLIYSIVANDADLAAGEEPTIRVVTVVANVVEE